MSSDLTTIIHFGDEIVMNKPTHIVYVLIGKGGRKFWQKIGVAFENRDGSLNVKLDSLPIDGKMYIRRNVENG